MADLEKHRRETEIYGIDFQDPGGNNIDEDGGETLTGGTANVTVTKVDSDGVWQDKTTEFGSLGESISGTQVNFTLNAASNDSEQVAGTYYIIAEVDTSESRHLAEIATLDVIDIADV
jgi:hypothetical protein